jgi:WD40 repeat protein
VTTLESADRLLDERGVRQSFDAYVVAAAFNRAGTACAFGLGDGSIRIAPDAAPDWTNVAAHDGALLSLAADTGAGWISGGDDGRFLRITAEGVVSEIASFGMKWVENVASFVDPKGKGSVLACSVGKHVHLFDADGKKLKTVEHPSTVTGLVFDAKGKRFAASHYNGASLWFVASKSDNPRRLEWKGSHTGVALNPDGDSLVTAMQENSLHGWRLNETQHMRMTGYPSKPRSLSFTKNGKWLASSGADAVVLWPFFGGGPMGKSPTELAGGDGVTCTMVACHPSHDAVAAGFDDGLVVMADINSARILPVAATGRGPVSALAWSPDGTRLGFGTETGFAAVVDFSKR